MAGLNRFGAGLNVPAQTERGHPQRQTPRPGPQAGPHRAACDRPNSTAFAPARHTATQEPMWRSPWQQHTQRRRRRDGEERGWGEREGGGVRRKMAAECWEIHFKRLNIMWLLFRGCLWKQDSTKKKKALLWCSQGFRTAIPPPHTLLAALQPRNYLLRLKRKRGEKKKGRLCGHQAFSSSRQWPSSWLRRLVKHIPQRQTVQTAPSLICFVYGVRTWFFKLNSQVNYKRANTRKENNLK